MSWNWLGKNEWLTELKILAFEGPDFHKELHLQKVNADKFVNINLSMSKEARARVSKKGNREIFIF